MKTVLLWIGMALGGAIAGFGVLAVLGEVSQPTPDESGVIAFSVVVAVIGAAIFTPCLVVITRRGRRGLLPVEGLESPSLPVPPGLAAPLDLATANPQWYGLPRSPVDRVSKSKLKTLTGIAAAVQPMLERDEQVVVAVRGIDRSNAIWWHLALGWIGQLIAAGQQSCYYLVFTDRRLFAFTSSQYQQTPRYAKFSLPRSELTGVTARRAFLFGRRLVVGWQGGRLKLLVPRNWRAETEQAAGLQPAEPFVFSSKNSW